MTWKTATFLTLTFGAAGFAGSYIFSQSKYSVTIARTISHSAYGRSVQYLALAQESLVADQLSTLKMDHILETERELATEVYQSPFNFHLPQDTLLLLGAIAQEQGSFSVEQANIRVLLYESLATSRRSPSEQNSNEDLAIAVEEMKKENKNIQLRMEELAHWATELRQDLNHDQDKVCQSRLLEQNIKSVLQFIEQSCKTAKPCRPKYRAKLQEQLRQVKFVDRVNSRKFRKKWGAVRLQSLMCEK